MDERIFARKITLNKIGLKRIFETVTNEPFSKRTNIRIFVRFDDVSIIKPNQRNF